MTNRRVFLTALAAIGAAPLAACDLPLPLPPDPVPPLDIAAWEREVADHVLKGVKGREFWHASILLSVAKYRELEPMLKAGGGCHITQQFEDGTSRLFTVERWHAEPQAVGWLLDLELAPVPA